MSAAAETFGRAAEACRDAPSRRGNVVHLAGELDVLVSGDIHGHLKNLAKIISHADLGSHPNRRLILQELIHGDISVETGRENSINALLRAARLKVTRPEQVHFVLGNHDIAQITGNEITKSAGGLCEAFERGVRHAFGDEADEVLSAVRDFLLSLPLAIRFDGGTWVTHSLPRIRGDAEPDLSVLDRPYRDEDFRRHGPAYDWTWGRGQTPEDVERLRERLGAGFFVLGHLHVEAGIEAIGERAVTLASDTTQGRVLPFRAAEPLDAPTALAAARRVGGLGA